MCFENRGTPLYFAAKFCCPYKGLFLAQIEILFFSKSWNNFSPKELFPLSSHEKFCSSSKAQFYFSPGIISFLLSNISLLPRRLNSISRLGLFPSAPEYFCSSSLDSISRSRKYSSPPLFFSKAWPEIADRMCSFRKLFLNRNLSSHHTICGLILAWLYFSSAGRV